MFTEPNPVSPAKQQASYEHQSLPLESEFHLQQFPHNWILHPDAKQRHHRYTTNVLALLYTCFNDNLNLLCTIPCLTTCFRY